MICCTQSRIDSYKVGLLSAHESFHAIVSRSFLQHLKKTSNYNSPDFNLFYFLQAINEEGIADLIDKPLLVLRNSPLYEEVKKLTENDESSSIAKIKKLDSLLTLAFKTETVIEQYQGFAAFANAYGKNGGHIPGRFYGRRNTRVRHFEKSYRVSGRPYFFYDQLQ